MSHAYDSGHDGWERLLGPALEHSDYYAEGERVKGSGEDAGQNFSG